MNKEELNQARTNPEFLSYLKEKEKQSRDEESISGLYEVLDTLLVLDLDENRINSVYKDILNIAFDKIEDRLKDEKLLCLENDDIYYIRSFYEHAIEKWGLENYDGAKELFFIIANIVEDEKLINSFKIHMLHCADGVSLDIFYDDKIIIEDTDDEKYGYFILDFKFDLQDYLKENQEKLNNEFKNMEHLLK